MAKLGSEKHPAVVRVPSNERAEEIMKICAEHEWKVIVGIEPGEREDITDVERLLHPELPYRAELAVGRNEPCPCGSGKKFKKCCGA